MGAFSVTGVSGPGSCDKLTTAQLSILANGPAILISGVARASELEEGSPPTFGDSVIFPRAFDGDPDNYLVFLTPVNGTLAYVTNMNGSETFTGFSFQTDAECDVFYFVAKIGIRAEV